MAAEPRGPGTAPAAPITLWIAALYFAVRLALNVLGRADSPAGQDANPEVSPVSGLETLALGFIAGATVFLGLPLARLRAAAPATLGFLNALSIGVLLFLFVEIMHAAGAPVEAAVESGSGMVGPLLALASGGFLLGLLSLTWYATRLRSAGLTPVRLVLLLAVGIGFHNFSEGLAIGSASLRGDLELSQTLAAGFALHNITEAFAIAGPLVSVGAQSPDRLSGPATRRL